jgi:hypothetical protein
MPVVWEEEGAFLPSRVKYKGDGRYKSIPLVAMHISSHYLLSLRGRIPFLLFVYLLNQTTKGLNNQE